MGCNEIKDTLTKVGKDAVTLYKGPGGLWSGSVGDYGWITVLDNR